eukprot:SAG22_NODE_516_length_9563_cov_29.476965_11_plen_100_part_00
MLRSESGNFFSRAGFGCTSLFIFYPMHQTNARRVKKNRGPKTNWFGRNKFPRPIFQDYFVTPSSRASRRPTCSCSATLLPWISRRRTDGSFSWRPKSCR